MDADKFIDIAYKCGYSTKGNAKKYVKDNPKEDYDMDDLIVLQQKYYFVYILSCFVYGAYIY